MFLVDTHAHLYLSKFDEDRDLVIKRAQDSGVKKILLPNIDLDSIDGMLRLCSKYPDTCIPMMGLHPCDVKPGFEQVLDTMHSMLQTGTYCAVGETGIDLYWDKSTLSIQIEAFRQQINWAKHFHLPLVIHARDSFDEIFEVLDQENSSELVGVFHCFTGNAEQAKHILNYGGFMLGIGGVVTYEKSGLDITLKSVPLDKIILETDAPFLAPKPYRGKRNESAYVLHVAEKLAQIFETDLQEIAGVTSENAAQLFKFN